MPKTYFKAYRNICFMKRLLLSTLCMAFLSLTQAQTPTHYCSKYKVVTDENRLAIEDLRSDSIDILHTAITLDFTEMAASQIEGKASLSLIARTGSIETVRLDFEGLVVDSVTGPMVSTHQHSDSVLIVSFTNALSQTAQTEVTVHYHGTPMTDASGWGGFYFTGGFSWNLGVGFADDPHSYGRIWFPCFDNFIERSTYEFWVRTNSDKRAACNGLLTGTTDNGDNTTTYHWQLAQPIPSYLACVAVGSYTTVSSMINAANGNLPVQIHARPSDTVNLNNSFIHLHDAVLAFEDAYGPYRFDKVGYSLVPFNSGAMEHATNIAYPISAANGGLGSEDLMAHELAHMWWGDNVTCQTDGDMWINEGWASFSEYLFHEAVYGRLAYEDAMKVDLRFMLQFGHHTEGDYRAVSGQPHEYVYGDHVYKKGALVAHNLRGYMGDDAFFDAVHDFMEHFKYTPVSSDSLEKYFTQYSGQDLTGFFRDWVFRPGYNVVVLDSFISSPTTAGYDVQMHLQQKLKGAPDFHTDVPVYYTVYDANWNSISGKVEMSGQYSSATVSSAIEPVLVVLYDHNEQAQARTVDKMVLNQEGGMGLDNMLWDVDVETINDSALVWFEHIWAEPDPIKDFDNKPYRLSNYHYWRVSGLGLENVEMTSQFFYDGRTTSGNSGYLDMDLVSVMEDSLVLLHRADAYGDWEEYEHYEKNVLGLSTNAIGLIELSEVESGEYTLANIDHTVLSVEHLKPEAFAIYPNPTQQSITVAFEGDVPGEKRFELYDLKGSLMFSQAFSEQRQEFDVQGLSAGNYVFRLHHAEQVQTGNIVIIEP